MLMRFFIFKIYESSLAGRHNNSSLFVMARSRKWLNSQRHKNEKSFCEFAGSCRVEKRDFCESFQSVHLTKTLLDTFRRKEERGKKGQILIADSFAFDGERVREREMEKLLFLQLPWKTSQMVNEVVGDKVWVEENARIEKFFSCSTLEMMPSWNFSDDFYHPEN